jgi:hypothetical protein
MPKQFKMTFPSLGEEVIVTMLEDDAPATCEMFARVLAKPFVGSARHGHDSGPELYVLTPPAPDLPDENSAVFPAPGDILFYHYDGQLPRGEKVYDIGIYYDRGGHGLLRVGWTPGNLFAVVTGNLAGLQRVARQVHETGPKAIRLEIMD